MNHADAAHPLPVAGVKKYRQTESRFIPVEAMQVQLRLNRPIAAPQPAQRLTRYAGTQKNPFITRLDLQ